jgi:hypothetical protein
MNRLTDNKIVLVTRPTRLAELVIRFNTVSQARFYLEHQGADFQDYLREDETYHHALAEAHAALAQLGRVQTVDRSFLPNFVFGTDDTIVTLGQDGLVANTLKYLDGQPKASFSVTVLRRIFWNSIPARKLSSASQSEKACWWSEEKKRNRDRT